MLRNNGGEIQRGKQIESLENERIVKGATQNGVIPKGIVATTLDLGRYTSMICSCEHKGDLC